MERRKKFSRFYNIYKLFIFTCGKKKRKKEVNLRARICRGRTCPPQPRCEPTPCMVGRHGAAGQRYCPFRHPSPYSKINIYKNKMAICVQQQCAVGGSVLLTICWQKTSFVAQFLMQLFMLSLHFIFIFISF